MNKMSTKTESNSKNKNKWSAKNFMNSKLKQKNSKLINNVHWTSNKSKVKNFKNFLQRKIVTREKFPHWTVKRWRLTNKWKSTKINNTIFMNRTFNKPISTKRLKTNATLIKSNRKDWQKYSNRLKNNNKSTVSKPRMLTQNIIRSSKSWG